MELYFFIPLPDEQDTLDTFHLAGGGDGFDVVSFVPSTCDAGGGRETILLESRAATAEELEENIGRLQRWLHWAEENYRRGEHFVYLAHRPVGRAEVRRARVRSGALQRLRWKEVEAAQGIARFTLTVEHDTPEAMYYSIHQNLVRNPSFEVDTDGNGLADNWTVVAATVTCSMVHIGWAVYPHGEYYQSLAFANVGAAVASDAFSVKGNSYYCLIAHVLFSGSGAPGDQIAIEVLDGANAVRASISYLRSEASTIPVRKHVTFYGWNGAAKVRIICKSGTPQIYVDAISVSPTPSNPEVWTSYFVLNDHEDRAWNNAGGMPGAYYSTHSPCLDILGIPGDFPATFMLQISPSSTPAGGFAIGAAGRDDGILRENADAAYSAVPDRAPILLQAENAEFPAGTLITDAYATGPASNNALQISVDDTWDWRFKFNISRVYGYLGSLRGKYVRLGLIYRQPSGGATTYEWGCGDGEDLRTNAYTISSAASSTYCLAWGPRMHWPPWGVMDSGWNNLSEKSTISVHIRSSAPSPPALYIDALLLLPEEGMLGADNYPNAAYPVYISPDGVLVFYGSALRRDIHPYGRIPGLGPGDVRLFVYFLQVANGFYQHALTCSTLLKLRPRYSSL